MITKPIKPKNNNIEVSFETSMGDIYFTKIAQYKEVCNLLFATDFLNEIRKNVVPVKSEPIDYVIKMRIGKVWAKQRIPQDITFNAPLLHEIFEQMQHLLLSLTIDAMWEGLK